jgi:hypothetical protein
MKGFRMAGRLAKVDEFQSAGLRRLDGEGHWGEAVTAVREDGSNYYFLRSLDAPMEFGASVLVRPDSEMPAHEQVGPLPESFRVGTDYVRAVCELRAAERDFDAYLNQRPQPVGRELAAGVNARVARIAAAREKAERARSALQDVQQDDCTPKPGGKALTADGPKRLTP